ncbi:MAG: glycoside hydrolase family 27 protein [Bacteroidetes bacterium]|nr:glycoside hydrolase family 27 protein [Bacteroidota bacterium]
MKKIFILTSLVALCLLFACNSKKTASDVNLNKHWKFMKGDDLAWALPGFNDQKWDALLPDKPWEDQGIKDYDGFAWYRIKTVIPAELKESSYFKDSLRISLGKIDDCDQVFLNGELIGENGKTILGSKVPGNEFIKEKGFWYLDRRYVLPVTDPRIRWDKENVIAVRVYDQGGLGGMFASPFVIVMVDMQDYLGFDLTEDAFTFVGDTMMKKKFSIHNTSVKENLSGSLVIKVILNENGNTIFERKSDITIKKLSKLSDSIQFKADVSKPAKVLFSFIEKRSGKVIAAENGIPYILTPKITDLPKINGAKVFGVRPWSPFLFKIPATGKSPLIFKAEDLPKGLKIDSVTGIISGVTGRKGETMVHISVRNPLGIATRDLKILVGNMISLTPPLGWNSWNCWGLSVSDKKVRQSAENMMSSGLADHGWTYINIDDGWEDKHDKDGTILPNYKFPNMKGLCDYIHSRGLKIGIYSSPGTKTCGGYEGSYTFEEKDAAMYAGWGIDYLKYDWCSYGNIYPKPTLDQLKLPYQVMKRALRKVNRDIHFSLCQYGMGDVWKWGAEVDGNSWRTTGDIEDTWESLSGIGFIQDSCSPYARPGRWNDPDMLVVGYVGWGPSLHYTRLTPDEQYTHITLWSLLSAPMLIGCDLSQIDPFTFNLLANDEVLAIDQDPLGKQATRVRSHENYQIWVKELEDGSKAVGIFNLTAKPLNIIAELNDLNLKGYQIMRDVWRQKDLGIVQLNFEMNVQPHGAALLKLTKK